MVPAAHSPSALVLVTHWMLPTCQDLNADPYNLHNTYASLAANQKAALAAELAKYKACTGGGCFIPAAV